MSDAGATRLKRISAACSIVLLAAASAAPAQSRQDLEPVDPNVGDLGPLSTSLRDIGVDLRRPTNFDRVFRAPGLDHHFMRANGALHAVFPRSMYEDVRLRRGGSVTVPVIPGGTVFYIGSPSFEPGGSEPRASSTRGEASAPATSPGIHPLRLHPSSRRTTPPAPISRAVPQTIVTDPAYRAARLHQLMRRAARAATQTGAD